MLNLILLNNLLIETRLTLNNLRDNCLRLGFGDLILVLLLQVEVEIVALAVFQYRAKSILIFKLIFKIN